MGSSFFLPTARRSRIVTTCRITAIDTPATRVDVAGLVLGLVCFLTATALGWLRHAAFATGRHDLEIYTQVTWSLANGAPFATTLLRSNTLHLAEHLALALLPLAPLYGLVPDPRLLIAAQQFALAASVTLVAWWSRERLGPRVGLLVAVAALLSPMLMSIALDDFHPIVLATPPLALALIQALRGCWRSAGLLALTATLMEEEASLALAGLGLLLFVRRPRGAGVVLTGAASVFLACAVLAIMPGFHQPGTLPAQADGNRTLGHFTELRSRPSVLVDRLVGQRGRDAAVQLLLPAGGLSLLSPSVLLAGAPTFAALVLQDRDDTFTRHWAAPLFPVAWLAVVATLVRLPTGRRRSAASLLALGTAAAYLLASPLPGGGAFAPQEFTVGEREAALARAVALVPPAATVVASPNVVAHLANRPAVFFYPTDEQYADALGYADVAPDAYILDLADPDTQRIRPLSKRSPLAQAPPFVIQSTEHKLLVLLRSVPPPTYPFAAQFGKSLALRGYDVARSDGHLRLTLHWESTFEFASDIRRYVTLLDARGNTLATDDELELTRTFPTQKWPVGMEVLDEVDLPLPAGAGDELRARIQWRNRDQDRPYKLNDGRESVDLPLQTR